MSNQEPFDMIKSDFVRIIYNVRIIIKYDCGHYGIIDQRRICFEYKRDQIKKGIQANVEKAELKGGMWILRGKTGEHKFIYFHCSKSKTQITVKKKPLLLP